MAEEILMVDVSRYQPKANYQKLLDYGISGVIAKATQGATYRDPTFLYHAEQAEKHNMFFGAYHFMEYTKYLHDFKIDADNFINTTQPISKHLNMVAVDFESANWRISGSELSTQSKKILTTIESAIPPRMFRPFVYTNPNFWLRLANPDTFTRYPLWIANYTEKNQPAALPGWGWNWTIWQKGQISAERFEIPNCSEIDLNIWNPEHYTLYKTLRYKVTSSMPPVTIPVKSPDPSPDSNRPMTVEKEGQVKVNLNPGEYLTIDLDSYTIKVHRKI